MIETVLHWALVIALGWLGLLIGLGALYVSLFQFGHWYVRRWPRLGSAYYVADSRSSPQTECAEPSSDWQTED